MLNEKFKIHKTLRDGKKYFYLDGIIDEDTDFHEINADGGPYVFNFKDVKTINSCGVRSWVNFIKLLQDQTVYYEQCPPIVVRQLNMIPSFKAHAKIMSIYVTYICDSCDYETNVLIENDKFSGTLNVPDSFPCEFCHKDEVVIDGKPEQIFAFSRQNERKAA